MQADHFSANARQHATGLTPPEAGSFARATRHAARLRPLAHQPCVEGVTMPSGKMGGISLFLILFLLSVSTQAAQVRLYFQSNTNYSTLDTNVLIATPISGNVLANGGVIAQGLPFRINNPSGVVTQSFNVGWFSISNRFLNRGIVINVFDSSSTIYDLTNVLESGFNTYKKTIYGTNPPPTYDELTNAFGYVPTSPTTLNSASNVLQVQINAATNSGITAVTATNISITVAGQATNDLNTALVARDTVISNSLRAQIIGTNTTTLAQTVTNRDGFSTNLTIRALGAAATKAISVSGVDGNEYFYVTDEGIFYPGISSSTDVDLIGINSEGRLVRSVGNTFTNDIIANALNAQNATNIYGAGLTTITNAALTVAGRATNDLNTTIGNRLTATNTLILTTLTNNLNVTSNGLSVRLIDTNTALTTRITAATNDLNTALTTRITNATNSLAGAISNRYNNADTVVSNGLYALIGAGGILTLDGYGTNTTLVFMSAANGTNNAITSAPRGSFIASGEGNSILASSPYSLIGGGIGNTIGTSIDSSSILGGTSNLLIRTVPFIGASYSTIAGGIYNESGGLGSFIGAGTGNIIAGGGTNGAIVSGYSNYLAGRNGFIGAGQSNIIAYPYSNSVVPGGRGNEIYASSSFAAGTTAIVSNHASFVWADDSGGKFYTSGTNQFLIRASGGMAVGTNDPAGAQLRVAGTLAADRISFGGRELFQSTTNVIAVTNAGTASANGLFRIVSSTHYTNDFTGSVLTNNTPGNWQIKNGTTVLYSGATPVATTTIQSGAAPAPTSAYGNYFNTDGTEFRGVVFSTNINQRIQTAVSTFGSSVVSQSVSSGSNTFVGSGVGLTNTPWLGMSNYQATAYRSMTNRFYYSLAGSSEANGWWYYSASQQTFTNASGCGFDYSFGPAGYLTNTGGSFLYVQQLAGRYDLLEVGDGAAPVPTLTPTNETFTAGSYRATTNFNYSFGGGLSGSSLLFGDTSTITNYFGPVFVPGTGWINQQDYPIAVFSSQEIDALGPYHTIASSRGVTIKGQRATVLSSGEIDLICTNADYAVIASEFGRIRNGQGVGLIAACNSFGDYSPSGTYSVIGASTWTNSFMHFASVLGGAPIDGYSTASYFDMNNAVGINTGSSTNISSQSVVIGPLMTVTNARNSTIIGQGHVAINSPTNVFLFGQGLNTTSNNVTKIGYPGWHLLIMTNKLQLISNNVAFNISMTPAP